MRGGPAGTAVRARAARVRARELSERAERRLGPEDWLPPRLLAGRIVKLDALYQQHRITRFDHERLRAHAWRLADLLDCRTAVKRAVSEIRWLVDQRCEPNPALYREAARLFG